MECKKLLKKLNLKGYLVTEGALKPINHSETIKEIDMDKQVIVIKLDEYIKNIERR